MFLKASPLLAQNTRPRDGREDVFTVFCLGRNKIKM